MALPHDRHSRTDRPCHRRELVHEAGVLDNINSNSRPDRAAAALILRCVLNPDAVGTFIHACYALERLDDLLSGDAEPSVPDLAAACHEAGAANQ
jgi:hypothetical protein